VDATTFRTLDDYGRRLREVASKLVAANGRANLTTGEARWIDLSLRMLTALDSLAAREDVTARETGLF
jgi:hypothetical protein